MSMNPHNVAEFTDLGRVRLSEHFFMREMLYSEGANLYGLSNIPENPDVAIATPRQYDVRRNAPGGPADR